MPTYSYKCPKCGHRFDGTAKMSDPCPPCPNMLEFAYHDEPCEAQTVKCFDYGYGAAPPAHFVGGGWAADKYHKRGN